MRRRSWLVPILLTLLAVAACGDDGPEAASESPGDRPAPSSSTTVLATVPPSSTTTEPAPVAPTGAARFGAIVLPVLESTCASCHAADQAGSDHFRLVTVADAVANADDIALQVEAGVMPPWPASHRSLPFEGDPTLSPEQIDAIVAWAAEGAPIDVAAEQPIEPTSPPSFIEDRDIVMTSAGGAYAGSVSVSDDYRCLIFDPGNTETEWILAAHLEADQTEVVHHGIITMATEQLRGQAEQLDASTPGPGWTCYGGNGLQAAAGGAQFRVGGWAPGAQPARQPEGYAIQMPPGAFFIVQIHYHYDGSAPPDLSRYVLDLASDEQVAATEGGYRALQGQLYLGPAEIPCRTDDTNPLCDRAAAIERVRSLYGDFVAGLPDLFLAQCGTSPADYAAMTDGNASSTCDLPVRNPGRIMSLTGHMHELGASIRLTLDPDTPDERILLDIPDWDFEWQYNYRPVDDVVLEAGDVIRIDCSWNRDRAPYEANGYILWADGTGDEMCYSNITTAPVP